MNVFTPPSETTAPSHPHPSKSLKRSFDVAFLMAPDEKLLQRRRQEEMKPGPAGQALFQARQSSYKGSAFTKVDASPRSLTSVPPQLDESSSQSGQPTTLQYPDSYLLLGHRGKMLYPHPLTASYPFTVPPSTSLLSTTFAAFGLPAQNVCAKCNVSFRMTSDLVYHMRSHHKGDSLASDPQRRRRDADKLRCPVCSESFRERHHLTRHMTAHQDKDGDYDGQ